MPPRKPVLYDTSVERERALLVSFCGTDESLDELERLAETAGVSVCGRMSQTKDEPSKRTLIGGGKAEEAAQFCRAHNIDVVIFDNELTGIQLKNLTDETGCRVIDRSMLILDIFAARANSSEGKLQVELAQMKYTLPRLVGIEKNMAKMRAGGAAVGMRGPGEKKLETDRRVIKERVYELETRLAALEGERNIRRARRAGSGVKRAALVGYTNAGKSTLLNLLARADVLAEDKLFATLDPVTRKVCLNGGKRFTLTDTVGFINNLPHEFIRAFKSTLEEAKEADLLLHVMDCGASALSMQHDVVLNVLSQLGIEHKNIISVYNKSDLVGDFSLLDKSSAVLISAKTGAGIEELKAMTIQKLGL